MKNVRIVRIVKMYVFKKNIRIVFLILWSTTRMDSLFTSLCRPKLLLRCSIGPSHKSTWITECRNELCSFYSGKGFGKKSGSCTGLGKYVSAILSRNCYESDVLSRKLNTLQFFWAENWTFQHASGVHEGRGVVWVQGPCGPPGAHRSPHGTTVHPMWQRTEPLNMLQVFTKGGALYGFKGLVGRLAPIGVHLAILFILGGSAYSSLAINRGSTMTPQVPPNDSLDVWRNLCRRKLSGTQNGW
jgi:hypothetical protein